MRDADAEAMIAAWDAGDHPAFVAAASSAGLGIEAVQMQALVEGRLRARHIITAIRDAVTDPHGIALQEVIDPTTWHGKKTFCLAVHHQGQVTIGVGWVNNTPLGLGHVWPELKPWFKRVERNRERCEAWAVAPAERRVRIPYAPPAVAPAPSATLDEATLLHQIVEHPDDVALRLVYADALLSREHPRGELIRLATEGVVHQKRIDEIIERHRKQLAGEAAEVTAEYSFADGFVDSVVMSAAAFRKHGEQLFASQPIKRLTIAPLDDRAIATLATTPHLAGVRVLQLKMIKPKTLELAPLVKARLDRLERLELRNCILAPGCEHAFGHMVAPRLRELYILAGLFPGRALRGLAANRALCSELAEIEMWMLRRTVDKAKLETKADAMAREAFGAMVLPKLSRLRIRQCWFTDDRAMAGIARNAPALTRFEVDRSGPLTMTALAGCRQLEHAMISGACTPATLAALFALPKLWSIYVNEDPMTEADGARLADTLLALPAGHPLTNVYFAGPQFQRLRERFI